MGLQDKRTAGRTEQWDLWGERLVILKRESGQKAAEGADAAEERNSGWDESRAKGCGRQSPGQSPSAWCSCHVESPPTLTGLTSPVPRLWWKRCCPCHPRRGHRQGNFCPALFQIPHSQETQLQHSEATEASLRRNPPSKEQGRPAKSRHNLPPREQVALGGDPLSPVKLGATAAGCTATTPSEVLTQLSCLNSWPTRTVGESF